MIGGKIVAADGLTNGGVTTESEAYTPKTNAWKAVASDLTARTAGCSAAIAGSLYLAGGQLGASASDTNILDAYDAKKNSWAAKANMPQATVAPGSATVGGRLYCFSGATSGDPYGATFYDNTQVYQP